VGKIQDYLVNERNQKPAVAAKIAQPFENHEDLRRELEEWIERRCFARDSPLVVEGYTAEMIFGLAPFMDGVGVYNFMVTLRERPDWAKQMIAAGFPRR